MAGEGYHLRFFTGQGNSTVHPGTFKLRMLYWEESSQSTGRTGQRIPSKPGQLVRNITCSTEGDPKTINFVLTSLNQPFDHVRLEYWLNASTMRYSHSFYDAMIINSNSGWNAEVPIISFMLRGTMDQEAPQYYTAAKQPGHVDLMHEPGPARALLARR